MNLELWKQTKKEKKLTIQKIAEKANLPKGTVQNIFCGYIPNPRPDTVEAIERALGLSNEQDYNLSPKGKELVNLLMELDDKQLEDALSVIKIIAKK